MLASINQQRLRRFKVENMILIWTRKISFKLPSILPRRNLTVNIAALTPYPMMKTSKGDNSIHKPLNSTVMKLNHIYILTNKKQP